MPPRAGQDGADATETRPDDQDESWEGLAGQADADGSLHMQGKKDSWWTERHDVPGPGLVLLLAALALTAVAFRQRR